MTFIKGGDNNLSSMVNDTLRKNTAQEFDQLGLDLRSMDNIGKEAKIKRIALQFEEMLVNTLLNSAFKEDKENKEGMALGFGPVQGFRNTLLSQHIANNGGLGYRDVIEEQIRQMYQGEKGAEKKPLDMLKLKNVSFRPPINKEDPMSRLTTTPEPGNKTQSQQYESQPTVHPVDGPHSQHNSQHNHRNSQPGHQVTSEFGWRPDPIDGKTRFHNGIDFRVALNTPIKSFMAGEVVFSGWEKGYGNTVEIRHADGYTTRYAHNSKLLVKKGDQVKAGTEIARSGSSGRSTGPHLHFEIRKGNRPLDPRPILKQEKINVLAKQTDIKNEGF